MSLDQSRLVNVPPGFGAGQMGNFALPGNNQTEDIIEEETLYDNAISHHIGAHPASNPHSSYLSKTYASRGLQSTRTLAL